MSLSPALKERIDSYDNWQLTAVQSLSAAGRSLSLALAVSEGRLTVKEALPLMRQQPLRRVQQRPITTSTTPPPQRRPLPWGPPRQRPQSVNKRIRLAASGRLALRQSLAQPLLVLLEV